MPPKTEVVVFLKIDTLKLKEQITDLYVYQDNIRKEYSIYYNDEIKFPYNIEKGFYKRYGKVKNFFNVVKDIKVDFSYKEGLIKIIYYL